MKPEETNEIFEIVGNWSVQARQLKEKYTQLNDRDLIFEPGSENELISRMEIKLNKNREEIINIIKRVMPMPRGK